MQIDFVKLPEKGDSLRFEFIFEFFDYHFPKQNVVEVLFWVGIAAV